MNESPIRQQLSDGNLDEYASSDTQRRHRAAVVEHGSIRAAADALGISRGTLSESVNRLVKRAAQRGYAPAHGQSHPAPPGQSIRGVSTLYNAAGEVQAQWVKTKASPEDLHEQLRVFVEELRETAPRAEPARPPLNTADDTLAVYPIGDPHMGMFAWREEGGEDFDLKIATRDMRARRRRSDGRHARQQHGGRAAAGRLSCMETTATTRRPSPATASMSTPATPRCSAPAPGSCWTWSTPLCAGTTKSSFGWFSGNHDPESSLALALILDAHFSDEPRVKVDLSSSAFWYHRFGSTLHRQHARRHGEDSRPRRHHGGRPAGGLGCHEAPRVVHRPPAQPPGDRVDRRRDCRGGAHLGSQGCLARGAGLPLRA